MTTVATTSSLFMRIDRLPEDIVQHIFEFSHPYRNVYDKEVLTKEVNGNTIWERAWLYWYRQQTDPILLFVMEYMFMKWNIFSGMYEQNREMFGALLPPAIYPDGLKSLVFANYGKTSVAIYDDNAPDKDILFVGDVYTREQYSLRCCRDEDDDSPNFMEVVVHWDEEYWLVWKKTW